MPQHALEVLSCCGALCSTKFQLLAGANKTSSRNAAWRAHSEILQILWHALCQHFQISWEVPHLPTLRSTVLLAMTAKGGTWWRAPASSSSSCGNSYTTGRPASFDACPQATNVFNREVKVTLPCIVLHMDRMSCMLRVRQKACRFMSAVQCNARDHAAMQASSLSNVGDRLAFQSQHHDEGNYACR